MSTRKLLVLIIVLSLALSGCGTGILAEPESSSVPEVEPPTSEAEQALEEPVEVVDAEDTGACVQDDSVTDFPSRPDLDVNGTLTGLQVRDANCPRALYHDETGVAKGKNWAVDIPADWIMAFAAVTCEVHEDGGEPVQYMDTPFFLIYGPWQGSVGCYEAGVHGTVVEWEDFLLEVILPVHESEVGHSVDPTIIGK